MLFTLTPISLAIFVAAFVNVFVTYTSWQRRKAKGGRYFAFAMIAITFWTLCAGLDYAAVPAALKVTFAKLEYLGYTSAIALFAAFALSYTGYEHQLKKPWLRFLLIGIPAVDVLLAWTNEWHGWVWASFTPNDTVDNVLVFEHGPAFTWIALSCYALILIIFVSLLAAVLKGTAPARKQARLLLGALIALVASNLLYLIDIFHAPGVDWSSVTFSITGLFFLFALYGSRFMDIVPIARNALIDRMTDGVLVLDVSGNLVDFNPAAQQIFGLNPADLWTPLSSALTNWPEIVAVLGDPTRPSATEITIGHPARTFDLRLTVLGDNRHDAYGMLAMIRDTTVRKQMEDRVRQAKEMAEDANAQLSASLHELAARNEELDAFAHTVAHDIRSPVAQIVGFAELLNRYFDELEPGDRRLALNTLISAGGKLTNIIDELLLLAGLRNVEVQLEPLAMGTLVREAQARVADLIRESAAVVDLPDDEAWPIALGYPAWIEEVWVNYLSNACKYGGLEGAPPHITLGADLLPDLSRSGTGQGCIRFWVRDTGRGLTPDAQARLFTPFTRLDQVSIKGHGLGLSIARRIVEKLGGEVGVKSDGIPGHGSEFSFTLPAVPVDPDPDHNAVHPA